MKKFAKIILFLFLFLFILCGAGVIYYHVVTMNAKLDESKLISVSDSTEFYDLNGKNMGSYVKNGKKTSIETIPEYTLNAFIAIEDKNFYKHNGIDYKGILRAAVKDLMSFSFKEGGSTISQQLIKNTQLSGEKTIKRKMTEIRLTGKLEQKYSKKEILEYYLNTVYFGKSYYGIENAAQGYFDKKTENLTVNESAVLAAVVKSPNYYTSESNGEKLLSRRNLVLEKMFEQGYLKGYDLNKLKNEKLKINYNKSSDKNSPYISLCLTELSEYYYVNPYELKNVHVYTYFEESDQKKLLAALNNSGGSYTGNGVLMKDKNHISAFYSPYPSSVCQPGSTIKPLAVYSPSLEENLINENTIINDEKTEFSGYKPKNYNNRYYGRISAKTALSKSLNIPAVKLLNSLGIDKSEKYLKRLGINLSDDEKGLSLALGGMKNGFTLTDLTSFYGIYRSGGIYYKPSAIRKVVSKSGRVLYSSSFYGRRVFSNATAYLTADMLSESVKSGTSSKLNSDKFTLYAKTGTVGSENGNTAAYSVSFTNNETLGIRLNNADNSYLPSFVTGSSAPTEAAAEFWNSYLKTSDTEIKMPGSVKEAYIDKDEYLNNGKFLLADDYAPESTKIRMLFDKKFLPTEKSPKYSSPEISDVEFYYKDSVVKIKITALKNVYSKIYRNGEEVYDTAAGNVFYDYNANTDKTYIYEAVPYFFNGEKTIVGKKVVLGKIKTQKRDIA